MPEEFIEDGVHMTNNMYKLGQKLLEMVETAPVARPHLADVTLQNFHGLIALFEKSSYFVLKLTVLILYL